MDDENCMPQSGKCAGCMQPFAAGFLLFLAAITWLFINNLQGFGDLELQSEALSAADTAALSS